MSKGPKNRAEKPTLFTFFMFENTSRGVEIRVGGLGLMRFYGVLGWVLRCVVVDENIINVVINYLHRGTRSSTPQKTPMWYAEPPTRSLGGKPPITGVSWGGVTIGGNPLVGG